MNLLALANFSKHAVMLEKLSKSPITSNLPHPFECNVRSDGTKGACQHVIHGRGGKKEDNKNKVSGSKEISISLRLEGALSVNPPFQSLALRVRGGSPQSVGFWGLQQCSIFSGPRWRFLCDVTVEPKMSRVSGHTFVKSLL